MHYIHVLRAPKVAAKGDKLMVELAFTIATDLRDAFLLPDSDVEIIVSAEGISKPESKPWPLKSTERVLWRSGMRVAKPVVEIPRELRKLLATGAEMNLRLSAVAFISADGVGPILRTSPGNDLKTGSTGLIMPAWVALNASQSDVDVLTRRLLLGELTETSDFITIEEDIGESMARHIWDGGVMALASATGVRSFPSLPSSEHSCMQSLKNILESKESLNILELGCGVGIFGLGFAALSSRMRPHGGKPCTVLMTDLDDAETRARANIARLKSNDRSFHADKVEVLYENLDWADGRQGRFGPQVQAQRWNLIIVSDCTYNIDTLPALVETLSALHSLNLMRSRTGEAQETKVFLATKPRHASERVFFNLISAQGWRMLQSQILPVSMLGADGQTIEMYVFGKT